MLAVKSRNTQVYWTVPANTGLTFQGAMLKLTHLDVTSQNFTIVLQ